MNKQQLTLGLALSLATTACTGLGVQTSPTIATEIFHEQGVSELWVEGTDEARQTAMRVDPRDDRGFDHLWMDGNSDWNGDSAKEAPRAAAMLNNPTLAVTW